MNADRMAQYRKRDNSRPVYDKLIDPVAKEQERKAKMKKSDTMPWDDEEPPVPAKK
jgi:hypothetical protein